VTHRRSGERLFDEPSRRKGNLPETVRRRFGLAIGQWPSSMNKPIAAGQSGGVLQQQQGPATLNRDTTCRVSMKLASEERPYLGSCQVG
jgi:hypothetical protein